MTASENLAGWAVESTICAVDGELKEERSQIGCSETSGLVAYFCEATVLAAWKPTAVCGSAIYDGVASNRN